MFGSGSVLSFYTDFLVASLQFAGTVFLILLLVGRLAPFSCFAHFDFFLISMLRNKLLVTLDSFLFIMRLNYMRRVQIVFRAARYEIPFSAVQPAHKVIATYCHFDSLLLKLGIQYNKCNIFWTYMTVLTLDLRVCRQNALEHVGDRPFEFSKVYIFGKFDAFCARLTMLTELFDSIQVYSRLFNSRIEGQKRSPPPGGGGDLSRELDAKGCCGKLCFKDWCISLSLD